MDESDLYHYALISCLGGFLLLSFVVLFMPISLSDDKINYIDGRVLNTFPSKNGGVVATIMDVGEKSLFLDTGVNLSKGSTYRFYNPSGEGLLFVSDFRILS